MIHQFSSEMDFSVEDRSRVHCEIQYGCTLALYFVAYTFHSMQNAEGSLSELGEHWFFRSTNTTNMSEYCSDMMDWRSSGVWGLPAATCLYCVSANTTVKVALSFLGQLAECRKKEVEVPKKRDKDQIGAKALSVSNCYLDRDSIPLRQHKRFTACITIS